jgi:hypothetical protein
MILKLMITLRQKETLHLNFIRKCLDLMHFRAVHNFIMGRSEDYNI